MPNIASTKHLSSYCSAFMSVYRKVLKKGIGYNALAVVSYRHGSLVSFTFVRGGSKFKFKRTRKPIGAILEDIPQRGFGGNLSGVRFAGKNVIREGNKLIIIKGDNSPRAWSRIQAIRDAREEIDALAGWE